MIVFAAGGSHNLVIREGGALFAWGCNNDGQLGDDTKQKRCTPVKVAAPDSEIAQEIPDAVSRMLMFLAPYTCLAT